MGGVSARNQAKGDGVKNRGYCWSVVAGSVLALLVMSGVEDVEAKGKPLKQPNNGPPLVVTMYVPATGGYGFDPAAPSATGVMDDGNPVYANGIDGVSAYFGVAGKDFDLVTYNSGRTFHFAFDPNSVTVSQAGLPYEFDAEVDMFGINHWGEFEAMAVGSTAQVQSDLEFKSQGITWELDYQALAVKRLSETEWLLTTAAADIGAYSPGFTPSDQAQLNSIKRRRNQTYGTVNMPIRLNIERMVP